jgi:Leucine rich repeat
MRSLRAEALRSLCGAPLQEVQCLHLDCIGLERIDSGLSECRRLRYLHLSGNALQSLSTTDLGACRDLWSLYIKNNQLCDVSGLSRYALLGSVDLSHNKLDRRALLSLRRTHILCLSLRGNAELSTLTRAQLISQLPLVWVLNDEFITASDRLSLLHDNSNSIDDTDMQMQLPAVATGLTASASAKALLQLQLPPWWCQSSSTTHAAQFAQYLCHEIPDISKAEGSRLKYLLNHYEATVREQNELSIKQSYNSAATAANISHKDNCPLPYTKQILSLSPAAMLDVAVMLTVKLRYASTIPVRVLKEALLIRLVTEIGSKSADDIAILPPYICTALIWMITQRLNELIQQQLDEGLSYDVVVPVLAYSELELLQCIPAVVTGVDTVANTSVVVTDADNTDESRGWQLLCRHTVILLSRSPNCPPLVAKHSSPLLQKQYELMKPLLLKAGMSHSDLSVSWENETTTVAGLRWNKQGPLTRNYPKLWNGDVDTTKYQQQQSNSAAEVHDNTSKANDNISKAVHMPHTHDLHIELSTYALSDDIQFSTDNDADNLRLGMYSRISNRSEQQQQYMYQHNVTNTNADVPLYTSANKQQHAVVATVIPNMCDKQWIIHGRRRVCIGDTVEVLWNVFTKVIAVDDHDDTVTVQKFKYMHKSPFLSSSILSRSDMLWESRHGGLWLHTQAAKQMQQQQQHTANDDMHATPIAVMVDSIEHQFIITSPIRHSSISSGHGKHEHWQSIETSASPTTVVMSQPPQYSNSTAVPQLILTRPSTSSGASATGKQRISSNALLEPQRPLQRR